jgi:hypothetical protein
MKCVSRFDFYKQRTVLNYKYMLVVIICNCVKKTSTQGIGTNDLSLFQYHVENVNDLYLPY